MVPHVVPMGQNLLQSCVQAARRMHSVGYESEFVRPFVTEDRVAAVHGNCGRREGQWKKHMFLI